MCVVIIKPVGTSMPTNKILEKCWKKNSDGAGFLYDAGDTYKIEKGFMDYKKFLHALNKHRFGKKDYVVIHFRLATAGSITPENTQPFPLSENVGDLQAKSIDCTQAMVHNGVAGVSEDSLSDTACFVRDVLSQDSVKAGLDTTGIQNTLQCCIGSDRMLVLDKERGFSIKLGSWNFEKGNGLYFSNTFWRNSTQKNNRIHRYCPYCKKILTGVYSEKTDWYCFTCNVSFVYDSKGNLQDTSKVGHKEKCPNCHIYMKKPKNTTYIKKHKVEWECGKCGNEFGIIRASNNKYDQLKQLTNKTTKKAKGGS